MEGEMVFLARRYGVMLRVVLREVLQVERHRESFGRRLQLRLSVSAERRRDAEAWSLTASGDPLEGCEHDGMRSLALLVTARADQRLVLCLASGASEPVRRSKS
jgi:hypothetical protein